MTPGMIPNLEKGNLENQNSTIDKFPPKEKFDVILGLFGSDKAREDFVSLCKEYDYERAKNVALSGDTENYRHGGRKVSYSPPQRARLHNRIMEIIAKLATQSKNLNPDQRIVLADLHSRENVAEAIHAYVLHERAEKKETGEDEDSKGNKKDKSELAYFHSLGKEH